MTRPAKNMKAAWAWFCALALVLSCLLLAACVFLISANAETLGMGGLRTDEVLSLLMQRMGLTILTAAAGVALALLPAMALGVGVSYLLPWPIRLRVSRLGFCIEAIPAVVLGYMTMRYIAPATSNPWLCLMLSLSMLALPRLFTEFCSMFGQDDGIRMASECLGGQTYQTVLHFSLPQHAREIGLIYLGAVARALCEGVAVIIALSAFEGYETLVTGAMRAVGVGMGATAPALGLAILQAVALLPPLSIVYITIYCMRER